MINLRTPAGVLSGESIADIIAGNNCFQEVDFRPHKIELVDARYRCFCAAKFGLVEHVEFYNCCFNYADFTDSILLNVRFLRCDLTLARGIVVLPVGDPRGYVPVAVRHGDSWRISAGCRWFTLEEARDHWGPSYRNRKLGDRYLEALCSLG